MTEEKTVFVEQIDDETYNLWERNVDVFLMLSFIALSTLPLPILFHDGHMIPLIIVNMILSIFFVSICFYYMGKCENYKKQKEEERLQAIENKIKLYIR